MGHPLGIQYLAEIDEESQEKRRELMRSAEAGDVKAQVHLGHIFGANWDGLGLDLERSRYWFQCASLQGNQSAQYMFLEGEGGPAEPVQGVYWLEKAAFGEVYQGAAVLADLYEVGALGLPRDLERAQHWRSQLENFR